MKSKLIFVLIALLLPTLVVAHESMLNEKMDELLDRIKQVQKDSPDAERQMQRLLSELNMDIRSPLAMRELSRLLQEDAPEELLSRQLQHLMKRYGHDHRDRRTEPRFSLPLTTADNRPLTSAQQAVIAQVLEDFQVNENVGGCDQYYPAIAVDGSGNFVVAWQDYRNGDADIYAERYSSSGVAQGANFRVNDDSGSSGQYDPAIAVDGSGNFVVAWQDYRNGNADIYAQRYGSSGAKKGANFWVNDDSGSGLNPTIAGDGSDNFVVAWQDYRNGNADIYAQRYGSSGAKKGANFWVNDDSGSSWQYEPAIAADGSGNFVVAWNDERNGNYDIYAQRYNNSGIAQGANFRMNDDCITSFYLTPPAIAASGSGNFMVVWDGERNRNRDWNIYAQRYNSSGVKQGDNFQVNDDGGISSQYNPAIGTDGVGNFVVVWSDKRNGNYDIYAQRFSSSGVKEGTNFRVDDDSGGSGQYDSAIAGDGSSNVVVVWRDDRNGDADIYAQRYNSSGVKQGTNFRVNDDTGSNSQYDSAIAADGSGNFVVVWYDYRHGNYDIYVQRYNSIGVKQGSNFLVNDNSGISDQYSPAIAADGSGNFVLVWVDNRNGNWDIYAQRYSSSGIAQGANFRVNDDSGSIMRYDPAIAGEADGNFVVVWSDERNSWNNPDIYAQRYNSSGVKQGTNFRVNDDTGSSSQYDSAIAADGSGNFVLVWVDNRNGNRDIYAQRYSSSGIAQGANFRINDDSGSIMRYDPAIAGDADGNFVVVWSDERNSWNNPDIYAQRYSSSGVKLGANVRVNDDSESSWQRSPAIAADGSGNFVLVWQDDRNGDAEIYAQLFDSQGQKIGSNYRVNNDTGTKDQLYPDVKLVNGHIYYTWQENRIEGQGWDIFARVDKFNFAPAAPGLSSPQNNSTITTNKPALTFTVPVDDNNDPLHFKVEIASNSNFTSHITGSPFESKQNPSSFSPTPPLPSGTVTCSFTVPTALTNGDYWWRVSAWDGTVYGTASEAWKFTVSVTPVYLQPVVNDHSLHQEFYVDIQIKDAQNLFGVAFKFNFPADKLEALAAEEGDFFGTDPLFFPNINNSAGVASIAVTKKRGEPAANGAGIVARIKLKEKPSVASGITIELSLTEVAANDPSGNAITLTPQNTSYVTPNPTSVAETKIQVPEEYALYPNYPNPFNPTTTISYAVPIAAQVRIQVFDLTGRLVKTLVDSEQQPGMHSIAWDARDDAGKEVANGMYICRMMAGGEVLHQKMILAK